MRYISILLIGLLAVGCAQTQPPQAPAQVPPQMPADITVALNGTGNFTSIQKAVESIPPDNHQRMVILIKDGVYKEKVRIDPACVTLLGQSRTGTRIEFPQDADAFTKNPDPIGRGVVNINGDDDILENLTINNTAGVIGPHAFAVYGMGDRTVITDSNVLSSGADTVALWRNGGGRYYHARCNFQGSVDFVCPRGWCYATDCHFKEMKNTACVWHDGHLDKDMKFVLRKCYFDGAPGFVLARHHSDAQFFFLDCSFSKLLADRAPYRVMYPTDGGTPTTQDTLRNKSNDKTNIWGNRVYFSNCHRDGGDFAWMKDNLNTAPGSPTPDQITPAWTFANQWNPQDTAGPKIISVNQIEGRIHVKFSEIVTVKGEPRLKIAGGTFAGYALGSGTDTLLFDAPADSSKVQSLDLNGGWIIASQASAAIRPAQTDTLPSN